MRYAWDLYFSYLKDFNCQTGLKSKIVKMILHYLRGWDVHSSNRVDRYISNSHYIAKRIEKIYNRKSHVIYPPVDVSYFELETKKESFYLTASRLVPYKKIDLIVDAFSHMKDKKLLVAGEGSEMDKIKATAKGCKNIEILGFLKKEDLKKYMQKAKAFVFAAIEDFGILPVEVQCCGTPVIALKKGGLKETVIQDKTGIFFENQDIASIIKAVNDFEKKDDFDPYFIRKHAEGFSVDRFKKEYRAFVNQEYLKFLEDM
jgi:glycosyltransferase involved in cell wall biosynthesis